MDKILINNKLQRKYVKPHFFSTPKSNVVASFLAGWLYLFCYVVVAHIIRYIFIPCVLSCFPPKERLWRDFGHRRQRDCFHYGRMAVHWFTDVVPSHQSAFHRVMLRRCVVTIFGFFLLKILQNHLLLEQSKAVPLLSVLAAAAADERADSFIRPLWINQMPFVPCFDLCAVGKVFQYIDLKE